METVVDRSLAQSEEIVFNAGSHTDAVRMKYADYANLAKPRVGRFGELPLS
jgi:Ala-tRNA(Pro) deacylase